MTVHHILGAGVMGLCTAVELAGRGAAVMLHDPAGLPGPHHCSWWAGGMLAPFCESETAEAIVGTEGRRAADWWQTQGALVTRAGTLVVAPGRDRAELDRFARRTTGHARISGDTLATLEPDLATPGREALSRGQEKLTALACILAQARAFAADKGEWPLVCLDDLASELDRAHQHQALASVLSSGAQVILTATEAPQDLAGPLGPEKRFHVEHGRLLER